MRHFKLLFILSCLSTSSYGIGTVNLAVAQSNIASTICKSGWTKTVRPSVSYTNKIKKQQLQEIKVSWLNAYLYELDHLVPLEVGGAPKDLANLRIQLWDGPAGARVKDVLETRVKRLVCKGTITLEQGQSCFLNGWQTCKY